MLEALKDQALKLKDKLAKNPLEKALEEATSNENWNASTKVLNEIADHTYNFSDFTQIMQHIWSRLSSQKKKWRKILKTLNLIEHLVKNGSPRCIQEFRDEIYQIRSLQDFSLHEDGADRGAAIREMSKRLYELLNDENKIDEERKKAQELRSKLGDLSGISNNNGGFGGYSKDSWKSKGKMEAFGSNSQKFGGFGSDSYSRGGSDWKSSSHYDDTSVKPKWRVEETVEPKKDWDRDTNTGDFTVKSGTKYNVDLTKETKKEEKPVETKPTEQKPKKLSAPGTKPQPVASNVVQQDLLDMDTPIGGNTTTTTTTTTTSNNNNVFAWDNAPVSQPQQQTQQFNWDTAKPNTNTQQTTNNNVFDWGSANTNQNTTPQNPSNVIGNLYNQSTPQNTGFGFGMNVPSNNMGMGGLSNQFGGMNFGTSNTSNLPTPNLTPMNSLNSNVSNMPNTSFTSTNNTSFSTNLSTKSPSTVSTTKNDDFDDFQVASKNTNTASNKEYKIYKDNEKSLIDLTDFSKEANEKKKQEAEKKQAENTYGSNLGMNYSGINSIDDLSFGLGPTSQNTNFGGNNFMGGNTGGFGGNMGMGMGNQGMNVNMGMYGNNPNMGGNFGMNMNMGMGGMPNMGVGGNQMGYNPNMMNMNMGSGFGGQQQQQNMGGNFGYGFK